MASVEPQATRKLLAVRTFADSRVPRTLRGDPLRLRQVIVNLLGNAVKFTEKGHVELRVTRVVAAQDECLLRFDVQETGIGMTTEERERIFAPFSQVDSSSTRRAQGTGLGLWLCKNLVARMGGKIGVESTRGRGSTFWFTVRVAEQDQALLNALPSAESPRPGAARAADGTTWC